jgi:FKBP-type peptidyl-prolyl cis-trans isomerase (trigger factor)
LDSIFIFPGNRDHYNRLFDDFYKIINIFNNLDELKASIKDNIKHLNKQIQLFSFYDVHQQSLRDISTQSPEFLW